jgi:hypothetical protein
VASASMLMVVMPGLVGSCVNDLDYAFFGGSLTSVIDSAM